MKIAILAVAMTGCAMGWTHPSKSQGEFNSDRYACNQESAASYPPAMVQQQVPTYQAPSTTDCRPTGGGNVTCTTRPGQAIQPIQPAPTDANATSRMIHFSSCMQARGWRFGSR